MSKSNEKKSHQLGEPYGTACNKMKKHLLFRLMRKCGMDTCFHCCKKIDDINKMSVEHKVPWLNSNDPVGLFYDSENICFAHLFCNTSTARNGHVRKSCPSFAAYRHGCRCEGCCSEMRRETRESKRRTRKTPKERYII